MKTDPILERIKALERARRAGLPLDTPAPGRRGGPQDTRPKLSVDQVRQLRAAGAHRGRIRQLAARFGVSYATGHNAATRKTYRWVPDEGAVPTYRESTTEKVEQVIELERAVFQRGPRGTLSDDQIRAVRAVRPRHGERTLERLAAELGVSVPTIYAIRSGRLYKHVL